MFSDKCRQQGSAPFLIALHEMSGEQHSGTVREQHPHHSGKEVRQGAPAVVARGMGLPEVRADGERPFVLSARNPNGALSVAALPRIAGERSVTPPADVIIDADLTPETPLGVFGEMKTLSLRASCQRRLFAQDLAGGSVHDITAAAHFTEGKVVLSGNALAAIGKEADADDSLPGTLVWAER